MKIKPKPQVYDCIQYTGNIEEVNMFLFAYTHNTHYKALLTEGYKLDDFEIKPMLILESDYNTIKVQEGEYIISDSYSRVSKCRKDELERIFDIVPLV